MTNVLIVEDSRMIQQNLSYQLSQSAEYRVIGMIANAANAEIICLGKQVDLILMDVCTADHESGLKAAANIKRYSPQIRILVMTSMPEYSFLEKAKQADCDGFWYKDDPKLSLIEACDLIMAGKHIWPERTPELMIGLARSNEFTDRELEVMRALSRGMHYGEIAQTLYISENTVKYHIKTILQKTGFRSTLQLVAEVVEKQLILPRY